MVSVDNLKVEFGVTPLFEDVSYVINKRDRIALVGKKRCRQIYHVEDFWPVCKPPLQVWFLFQKR